MDLEPLLVRPDNERHCADMIMSQISTFPSEYQEKLNAAYEAKRYEEVMQLAAESDLKKRMQLERQIEIIPNPNFNSEDPSSPAILYRVKGTDRVYSTAAEAAQSIRGENKT